MKTLEKDRAHRYATAAGLGRDIERYLRDEPIEARPPSATYRFRKFVVPPSRDLRRGSGSFAGAGDRHVVERLAGDSGNARREAS